MSLRRLIPISRNLKLRSNDGVSSTITNPTYYTQQQHQQYYVLSDDNAYTQQQYYGDTVPPTTQIYNCSGAYPPYAPIPAPIPPIQPIPPRPYPVYRKYGSEIQNMSPYSVQQPHSIGTAQAVPTPTPIYQTTAAVPVATKNTAPAPTTTS